MTISSFFKNTLGANLTNARWSWGASRPDRNQIFLRVWKDQLGSSDGVERIPLLRTDWQRTSAGFKERQRHVEMLRNGVEGYGVLCTAQDPNTTGKRIIASFERDSLLKFGDLIDDGNQVYAQITEHVPIKDFVRKRTSNSTLASDIKTILGSKADPTTKEALVNARVGQGKFRAQVLAAWGSKCCVTKSLTTEAIRASHIKPWRNSSDDERLDPDNGLPLVATLDALFDAGLITFAPDGELLISETLKDQERKLLGLDERRLIKQPPARVQQYLAYHREEIFVAS